MKFKQFYMSKFIPAFLIPVLILQLFYICKTSAAATDESWTAVASMSTARTEFQAVVINNKIYAIGGEGSTSSDMLSSMEVYDPNTNRWTTLASMSTPRFDFGAEVIDGKIYAIGGFNGFTFQPSVEVYDPNTNEWTTLAPMSNENTNFETEVIGEKIYAIGETNCQVYDPSTNKWTTLAPMSIDRRLFGTEVIDGKIYAIGGYTTGSPYCTSAVEVYDTNTNKWTTLAPMSTGRGQPKTGVIDGKICAIGGIASSEYQSSVEVYDPDTNKWTTLTPMSIGKANMQMQVINGKLYIFGGQSSSPSALSSAEVFNPDTNIWTVSSPMADARYGFESVTLNNVVYAIGGANTSGHIASVESLAIPESAGNALMRITFVTGYTKEYDLSASQANSFVSWYNGGASESSTFTIKENYNTGTLASINDYIIHKKISHFEVMSYNKDTSTPLKSSLSNTALLKVRMSSGDILEYEMTSEQLNSFMTWYNGSAANCPTFAVNKTYNLGPFTGRTDYLVFNEIVNFEVLQY